MPIANINLAALVLLCVSIAGLGGCALFDAHRDRESTRPQARRTHAHKSEAAQVKRPRKPVPRRSAKASPKPSSLAATAAAQQLAAPQPSAGSAPPSAAPATSARSSGMVALSSAAIVVPGSAGIVDEARRLFYSGQVMRARQALGPLASGPEHLPALELARTYDPHYLTQTRGRDAAADVIKARALYEDAIRKGSTDATVDLRRMSQSFGQN